jgi:hypothetical protein
MNHQTGSVFRGALIAYGVAFCSWYLSRVLPADEAGNAWAPGSVYMIAVGLVLQLLVLGAKWLVQRYEREHGMHGMLSSQVAAIARLLIDALTVMLFAVATFRSIAIVPSSI